ncbi:hypothetical protein BB559_000449 [Furculomyces boomerangus]|uniref:L-type lectin-like domain-containing protein n=2 Tax=Harpellales TaxID=61421 RepID=A0A2T9Z528_9FUNG|nr:hypothetical protein BB559_000449 [Furculomyces boomerangus]PVZ98355.1 hypothetical protein BB558_005642 [Smittium angustum]PWA02655.1 hypothetical protein BB558_001211 [Smittium angustum]
MFLLLITLLLLCSFVIPQTGELIQKLSINPPYIDQGFHIQDWDFGGDSIVDAISGIYLTPDIPSRRGMIWSTITLPENGWSVEFEFFVGSKNKDTLYGDGLAFWATKERSEPGTVFGNRNYFNGLGIFFDTYANGKNWSKMPLVVGMLGDGKKSYDESTDGLSNSFGSCSGIEFRQTDIPVKAKITYIAGKLLDVKLSVNGFEWKDCMNVKDFTIPSDLYLGFSAITGQLSDAHRLINVNTFKVDDANVQRILNQNQATPVNNHGSNSSFVPTILKLVLVCGVLFGVYFGYKTYSKRNYSRF